MFNANWIETVLGKRLALLRHYFWYKCAYIILLRISFSMPLSVCSCGQEEPTYSALWGDNKSFNEVIISPAMLNEHMPHMVMEGLNKVCEYNRYTVHVCLGFLCVLDGMSGGFL